MSHLLVIREMQIKTTVRYQFMSMKTGDYQNIENNRCWQGYEDVTAVLRCWWESKWGSCCGKQRGSVPRKIKHGVAI